MPLFKSIAINSQTIVKVWYISESISILNQLNLTPNSLARLKNMKSERHQLGFLSVRWLLQDFGYCDEDIRYDRFGKPSLKDGKYISISHSYDYAAVAVSDQSIGLDVEKIRNKIVQIVPRFIGFESSFLMSNHIDFVSKLTTIWCIKESLYKLYSKPGLSFKHQMLVLPFDDQIQNTTAWILESKNRKRFKASFFEFNGYVFAVTTPSI